MMDYTAKMNELFGCSILDFDDVDTLKKHLVDKGMFPAEDLEDLKSVPTLVDWVYKRKIRDSIIKPTFLYNYPTYMVPLARHSDADDRCLDMFQLLVCGAELCKGYSELVIRPAGAKSFSECLRMSSEIYMSLKSMLKKKYGVGAINLGDEGGFAPPLDTAAEAMETIVTAASDAGYVPGKDVFLALDAASSEFYSDGVYDVDGLKLSAPELADHYQSFTKDFPLISIEDPFFEDDFETTAILTKKVGSSVQIVGDDLFVTNTKRLSKGIEMKAANALLLKVNQIGTVTEAGEAAEMSFKNGYNVVVSHRSGESEDVSIADLSVGWGSGQIKTGAPARGERTAKYNRLLRIEEDLGSAAVFPGIKAFRK